MFADSEAAIGPTEQVQAGLLTQAVSTSPRPWEPDMGLTPSPFQPRLAFCSGGERTVGRRLGGSRGLGSKEKGSVAREEQGRHVGRGRSGDRTSPGAPSVQGRQRGMLAPSYFQDTALERRTLPLRGAQEMFGGCGEIKWLSGDRKF